MRRREPVVLWMMNLEQRLVALWTTDLKQTVELRNLEQRLAVLWMSNIEQRIRFEKEKPLLVVALVAEEVRRGPVYPTTDTPVLIVFFRKVPAGCVAALGRQRGRNGRGHFQTVARAARMFLVEETWDLKST